MCDFLIIAIIAGCISTASILASNVSRLLKGGGSGGHGQYECGFLNKVPGFAYLTENSKMVIVFLLAEVTAVLFLTCFSLWISCRLRIWVVLASVLLLATAGIIVAAGKIAFRKAR